MMLGARPDQQTPKDCNEYHIEQYFTRTSVGCYIEKKKNVSQQQIYASMPFDADHQVFWSPGCTPTVR